MSRKPHILIVAGLGDSESEHWQGLWLASHPEYGKVEQRDWERPLCSEWVERLDEYLRGGRAPSGPLEKSTAGQEAGVVLVAHSLACATVAHWAEQADARIAARIRAALLVAPADPEAPGFPAGPRGFAPMPRRRLPFTSLVVASRNDPYVSLERARHFAECWGASFVDHGATGHINLAAGFGPWPRGEQLLRDLIEIAISPD